MKILFHLRLVESYQVREIHKVQLRDSRQNLHLKKEQKLFSKTPFKTETTRGAVSSKASRISKLSKVKQTTLIYILVRSKMKSPEHLW